MRLLVLVVLVLAVGGVRARHAVLGAAVAAGAVADPVPAASPRRGSPRSGSWRSAGPGWPRWSTAGGSARTWGSGRGWSAR